MIEEISPEAQAEFEALALQRSLPGVPESWAAAASADLAVDLGRALGLLETDSATWESTRHQRRSWDRFASLSEEISRRLGLIETQWAQRWREAYRWWCDDADVLTDLVGEHTELVPVARQFSDPHRHGRRVIGFGRGDGAAASTPVLYLKARSLAADMCFADLVAHVGKWTGLGVWPQRRLITVGDHGWDGHIGGTSAQSSAHVTIDVLERYGLVLAVASALGTTDLHYENIVLCDGYPVVIDAETLLFVSDHRPARSGEIMVHPLDTGVLPIWLHGLARSGDPATMRVVSGLLGSAGSAVRRRNGHRGLVRLDEPTVVGLALASGAFDHGQLAAALVRGYGLAVSAISEHRADLLALIDGQAASRGLHGPGSVGVRVVIRPTSHYRAALDSASTPRAVSTPLASADRLRRQLDALGGHDVIDHEVSALHRLDIPAFDVSVDARQVFERSCPDVARVLDRTPLQCLADRLGEFGTAIDRDAHLIERSVADVNLSGREHFVDRCAEMLQGSVLWRDDIPVLIGVNVSTEGTYLCEGASDLGSGMMGVALVLSEHSACRGSDRDLPVRLADAALDQAMTTGLVGVGVTRGWAGMVLALSRIAGLCDAPELLDRAVKVISERLNADAIQAERSPEFTVGLSGALAVLVEHNELNPSVVTDAVACGAERLRHWEFAQGDGRAPGCAHGDTSVALGLVRAARLLGDESLRDHAVDRFVGESDRWLMVGPEVDRIDSWCLGTAGRELVAAELGIPYEPPVAVQDGDAVVVAHHQSPVSLCCGLAGAVEAAVGLGSDHRRLSQALAARIDLSDPLYAEAGMGPTFHPGLWFGYAGVMHALMCLEHPRFSGVLSASAMGATRQ